MKRITMAIFAMASAMASARQLKMSILVTPIYIALIPLMHF